MSQTRILTQSHRPAGGTDNPEARLDALERLLESMMDVCPPPADARLIVETRPQSGARNMAVDEALLESVADGAPATLRLYTWSEATVSLGHFQRQTPEIEPGGRFHGLAAVRRLSGGGAILHHRELTYSCCIPAGHRLASEPTLLYEAIHARIRATLAEFGIRVEPRGVHEEGNKTFLCFARGDRRDLVCEGFKVVGSAQRRRQGAILQHGSILLRRSPFLPEFPGVLDLSGSEIEEAKLRQRLASNLGGLLGSSVQHGRLSSVECIAAEQLEHEKYAKVSTEKPAKNV